MRGGPKVWPLLVAGVAVSLIVGQSAVPAMMRLWSGPEPMRHAETRTVDPQQPAEVLATAISALAGGEHSDLSSLFSDSTVLSRCAQAVGSSLPPGAVARVSMADDLNAGAENGHRVPVEVWTGNGRDVSGLTGEVSFVRDGDRFRISALELTPIPLRVTSWAQAAGEAGAPGAVPRQVPFLGRFRLLAGQRRLSVDARTGLVEQE